MSYTKVTRPWGMAPTKQDFEVADLQASSSGAQEVDFEGAQEVNVEFNTDCKVTSAVDAAGAATKIAAGNYKPMADNKGMAAYKEETNKLYVTNDTDSIASGALEISRYWYSL